MKLILSSLILFFSFNLTAVRASENIVGGQLVKSGDIIARRTVGLFMINKAGGGGICTGSILNKGAILTAAHCIKDARAVFVIFSINGITQIVQNALKSQPIQAVGRNYRLATNFRQLPGYSGEQGGMDEFSDLALITFNGGLPAGYEAANFLNQAEGQKYLKPGSPVIIAGYGITSVEERDSPSSTGPRTSGTLRQVTIQFSSLSANKKNMVLQGRPGKDACSGDSGGPAMVAVNGNVYVVGVASRSDCVTTSIYTWVPREKAARAAGFADYLF